MNGLKSRRIRKIDNPIGLDVIIQKIQESLEPLTWLEKSFGKALIYNEERNGDDYLIPKTYYKKGEYTPLDPDDTVKAYSFMYEDQPSLVQSSNKTRILTSLNLVVFANLEKINRGKDELFLEELLNDVLSVLNDRNSMSIYQSIQGINAIFKWLPDAFADFSAGDDKKYLKENYAAFRINFDVIYFQVSEACLNPTPPVGEGLIDSLGDFLIDNLGGNLIEN